MDFHIIHVNPQQADELTRIALAAKAHWGYPKRWLELWAPDLTFNPAYFEQYESWAAVLEERPIGFYTLQEKEGKAWLENLWVLPEYIGKSVGKTLFLHAAGLSRRRGYSALQLMADPYAAGFYEKMGMCRVGEHRYELEGHPRTLPIMEIKL